MAISPDRAALEALYESTGGEKWTNSDNWRSDAPIGEWYGVTTDGGRVTELVLVENGLVGDIPAGVRRPFQAGKIGASWELVG